MEEFTYFSHFTLENGSDNFLRKQWGWLWDRVSLTATGLGLVAVVMGGFSPRSKRGACSSKKPEEEEEEGCKKERRREDKGKGAWGKNCVGRTKRGGEGGLLHRARSKCVRPPPPPPPNQVKRHLGGAEEGERRCVVSYPARGVGWYSGVVEKGKDAGGTDFTSAGIWGEQEKGGRRKRE